MPTPSTSCSADAERRQKKLYDEIVGHIKETDDPVPFLHDGYYYYTRTLQGKQYFELPKKARSTRPEQVILDLNKMGEGEKFMSVGAWADGERRRQLDGLTTDNVGFRQYKLHIRDLRTMPGPTGYSEARGVGGMGRGREESRAVFTPWKMQLQKRSHQLLRRVAGSDTKQDTLVFEEKDERF